MILILGETSYSLHIATVRETAGYDYLLSVATNHGKALATKKVNPLSVIGRRNQS